MKKILIVLLLLAILFFSAIYLFLPARASFSQSVSISANPFVTTRIIRDDNWKRWWPGDKSARGDTVLEFNNHQFFVTEKMYKGVEVAIAKVKDSFNSSLHIIPLSVDSVKLDWMGNSEATISPFKRIQQYRSALDLQQDIRLLLETLKLYLQKQTNTYGMQIVEERVKDTLLVTTKSVFKSYPSVSSIYEMIQTLRHYINKQGLKEMNYPMLHVLPLDRDGYSTMVAIPVNKEMAKQNGIAYKRMAPGKILVTQVQGGPYAIQIAYAQYERYLQDYHRISPAIPFESLVTERISEPDTSKWVTKIYYPVF